MGGDELEFAVVGGLEVGGEGEGVEGEGGDGKQKGEQGFVGVAVAGECWAEAGHQQKKGDGVAEKWVEVERSEGHGADYSFSL